MPMYNLIEYSNNYSKTSGGLWQYYKDGPNDNMKQSESFKSKTKITGKTPPNGKSRWLIRCIVKQVCYFLVFHLYILHTD